MTSEVIYLGATVLCDLCNKDYTKSDAKGGFLFCSKAVCPECTPRMLKDIEVYGEEDYIRAICPDDMPFGKWVHEVLRLGKSATVTITTL